MSDSFIIRFERSGGFTGIDINKTIDSLQLKKEETEMLRMIIDHSDFFTLPAIIAMKPHPDRFTYKITVETEGKRHTVQFSQTSVPESLKDLIRYLIEKTRLKK
jgi:16S rRNA U516 pseudouridylate synthase RsuA-like enzyme